MLGQFKITKKVVLELLKSIMGLSHCMSPFKRSPEFKKNNKKKSW